MDSNELLRNTLHTVNKQKHHSRRAKWSQHRKAAYSLLDDRDICQENKTGSMIILGSGNCDDLEINLLAERQNSIKLVDIDIESTQQHVKNLHNIELLSLDLSGLSDFHFFTKFEDLVLEKTHPTDIISFIKETTNKIQNHQIKIDGTYNMVVAGAVHSQLILPSLLLAETLHTKFGYSRDGQIKITDALTDLLIQVTFNFNKLLLSLVANQGTIITWFDIAEIQDDHRQEAYQAINALQINRIYEICGGVGGAMEGLNDLVTKCLQDYTTAVTKVWNWKFDHFKEYAVVGIVYNKKT